VRQSASARIRPVWIIDHDATSSLHLNKSSAQD
jgi:hypothetical protein